MCHADEASFGEPPRPQRQARSENASQQQRQSEMPEAKLERDSSNNLQGMSVDLPDHWLLFPPFKRVAKMHMPDSPACRESILIADWSCLSPHCQRQVEEVGEKTLAEGKESPLAASHGIDYGREWSSRLEAQVVGVLSRFVVANDMAAAVKQAFLLRPHLVDNAQGYVRMDVLTPEEAPNEIWLLTYWDDLASYRTWHKSHAYHES